MTSNVVRLGIDIGSTTVKVAFIDEDGNILSDEYFSQPEEFNESEDNAKYYAGKLEVSNLIIEAGASVINNALGEYAAGGVTVYDRLVNNGTVTGGTIDINGDYSGNGVIKKAIRPSYILRRKNTNYF